MAKKRSRRQFLVAGLILFITQFLVAAPNLMAAAPLEKLTIGWSAIAGSQAPFWITKEAGLKKNVR
jgi:nucleoside recognition membrane protein YjiH